MRARCILAAFLVVIIGGCGVGAWEVPAVDVALGVDRACALLQDGRVACWGRTAIEQADGNVSQPILVPGLHDARIVTVGTQASCAARSNGEAVCWETNRHGSLGTGVFEHVSVSVPVPVALDGIVHLATRRQHLQTCAVRVDGTVHCWGGDLRSYDDTGRLLFDAVGPYRDEDAPAGATQVALPGASLGPMCTVYGGGVVDCCRGSVLDDVEQVSGGADHVCAVQRSGALWCWRDNSNGQVGIGTVSEWVDDPAFVMDGVARVAAGVSHTCAVMRDGTIRCWGKNDYGQLGDGSTSDAFVPTEVAGIDDAIAVDATFNGSCAVRADGSVWCWGHIGHKRRYGSRPSPVPGP